MNRRLTTKQKENKTMRAMIESKRGGIWMVNNPDNGQIMFMSGGSNIPFSAKTDCEQWLRDNKFERVSAREWIKPETIPFREYTSPPVALHSIDQDLVNAIWNELKFVNEQFTVAKGRLEACEKIIVGKLSTPIDKILPAC